MSHEPGQFFISKAKGHKYGLRGGKARARLFGHWIEGGFYTSGEVAQRLGVGTDAARNRCLKAAKPLTWHALGEKNGRR